MSVANRKKALQKAYDEGVRRCPCCNIQLVWKSNSDKPQNNLVSIDHIVPSSKGGSNTLPNYYIMCRKCNHARSDGSFVDFVTSRGIGKDVAEMLYRSALQNSVRSIISRAFYSQKPENTKKLRKNLEIVISELSKIDPQEVEAIRNIIPISVNFKVAAQ